MRSETLKGHLDGMLLASLESGPRHGYAIMEALRTGSDGQVDLPTGTIYPATLACRPALPCCARVRIRPI
jgi:DNA-binding PadR family transcriptional regulator